MKKVLIEHRDDVDSNLALESAAQEFRANLKALSTLEKTAEAVTNGDLGILEKATEMTELSNVSPALFSEAVDNIVEKALIYIMLEHGIKRIDVYTLLAGMNDVVHMNKHLTETMIDQDPRLLDKMAQSFKTFERLVVKFTIMGGVQNKINQNLIQQFYKRLLAFREAIVFLDINAKYFA